MFFQIFFLGLLILTILALVLIFKFIKNKTASIILSIVTVLISIGIGILGLVVLGAFAIGESISNSYEIVNNEEKEKLTMLKPKLKETGESKEIYSLNEMVSGNGFEILISNSRLEQINNILDTANMCAFDVKIKNIYESEYLITSLDFEMKESDGTIIPPYSFSSKTDIKNEQVELASGAETQKTLLFDCLKAENKPLTLEFKAGQSNFITLTNLISNESERVQFAPILFETNYK